jgi:hypothetical protein
VATEAGELCDGCGDPIPIDSPEALCPSCLLRRVLPEKFDAPDPQSLSRLLPQYRFEALLGRGGVMSYPVCK